MAEYNLNELNKQAKEAKDALSAKQRELYQYARNKGFSSYEAIILKSKDKETIDRLASERDGGE